MTFWEKIRLSVIFRLELLCVVVTMVEYFAVRAFTYLSCVSNCQALANTSPVHRGMLETCTAGCQFINREHFITVLLFAYLPAYLVAGAAAAYLNSLRTHRRLQASGNPDQS